MIKYSSFYVIIIFLCEGWSESHPSISFNTSSEQLRYFPSILLEGKMFFREKWLRSWKNNCQREKEKRIIRTSLPRPPISLFHVGMMQMMEATSRGISSKWRLDRYATVGASCAALASSIIILRPKPLHAFSSKQEEYIHRDKMRPDEILSRVLHFWRRGGPIICHYRFTQLWVTARGYPKHRRDEIYQKLHDTHAQSALDIILSMKGLFIKIGQVLSSRSDFVPKEYITLFSTVQDNIPPWPADEVKKIIDHSLKQSFGFGFHDVFESFNDIAIGSASIGQVHSATLNPWVVDKYKFSGSRQIAVKVMHTDAKDRFRHDFRIFKWLCRVALPGWKTILVEIERQMMTEFNYIVEADNLLTVKENMANSPYSKKVVIPEPLTSLCTKNLLIMEMLHGIKLVDAAENRLTSILYGDRDFARRLIDEKRQELFKGSSDEKDKFESYRCIIKEGDNVWKKMKIAVNLYLFSLKQKKILDLLLDVHGHQIFIDGFFNGDPHPGNILELDDGRLGLIDYGQCKHLHKREKLLLAKIVNELQNERANEKYVADAMREFGFCFKYKDKNDIVTQTARLFFDSDSYSKKVGCATPQLYLLYLQDKNPMKYVPDAAVMVARTSFLFRGMGSLFGEDLKTSKRWGYYAQMALDTNSH